MVIALTLFEIKILKICIKLCIPNNCNLSLVYNRKIFIYMSRFLLLINYDIYDTLIQFSNVKNKKKEFI